MRINTSTYQLSENNYIPRESIKKQIVIGHSMTNDMSFFNGWKTRLNGKFTRTTSFTIDLDGKIYQHFNPKYHSNYLGIKDFDEKIIPIQLVNEGWLSKDSTKKEYIDWIGNIYKRKDSVIERRWRSKDYWAPYTKKQIESLIDLIKKLSNDFSIPLNVVEHNTLIADTKNYEGVLYRSNIIRDYTDLSPAWDYNYFKTKIEK